jgi:photosystem II stability/assembly factor-like uncharacterized protein
MGKMIILILVILLFTLTSFAQDSATDPKTRMESWQHHLDLKEQSIFKELKWRTVGPTFCSGRIESIAIHPANPFTIYVGVGSGNIWKTVNNGVTWKPIFEKESTFTIGRLAIAPSDTNIIWVGTGEVLMARSSFAGTGVFKSVDAGKTWQNMGLHDTHHIGQVLIDPLNPDIVYIAAIGHNYTQNEERGLFKTSDGGKTWDKILYISDRTGVVEVVMDPSDNKTIYAVAWERDRKAWNNVDNGEGSGVYKSTDAGNTWKKLTTGLPTGGDIGRFGLAIAPSNPEVIYAVLDNRTPRPGQERREPTSELTIEKINQMSKTQFLELDPEIFDVFLREQGMRGGYNAEGLQKMIREDELTLQTLVKHLSNLKERQEARVNIVGGELYRSNNKGESWNKVNEGPLGTSVNYAFALVRVMPDNENELFILGNNLVRSNDGGKTFERIGGEIVHLLSHESTVLHLDHHEMKIDPVNPDRILLGTDGGLYISYDRAQTWLHVNNLPITEFYDISVDMDDPYNIYGGTQDDAALYGPSTHIVKNGVKDPWQHVYLDRWGGGDSYSTVRDHIDHNIIYYEHQFGRILRKNMVDGSTIDIMPREKIGEPPLRYNWMTPFVISHYNPFTLYYATNMLFKSIDRGDSWKSISPDLSTQPGPEKQGKVPYGTITTISESPLSPGLIYAGTDDGNVYITKNDGVNWSLVSNNLPEKWISRVVASRHERGTVYVSLTGYREDDFEDYVYISTDFGNTWQAINGNLPAESINVIDEDPKDKNIIYVGTDLGIYVSINRGENWYSLCNNLPTCAVHDLVVHPRESELVIGTHGRSNFVLDVGAIQEVNSTVLSEDLHFFNIKPARLALSRPGRGVWEQGISKNAAIYYYLKKPKQVEISVLDESGNLIKNLQTTNETGINAVVWDLSVEDKEDEPRQQRRRTPQRRFVKPGDYKVILTSDNQKLEKEVHVRPPLTP